MHIYPFQAVYPNFDYITSADSFFGTVKHDYPDYNNNGFFRKSAHEGFYAYQIIGPERNHYGLIACADIRDFIDGNIKKHENTLPGKEQQQMHLLIHRKAMVKPVLLTFPDTPALEKLLKAYMREHTPFYSTFFEEEEKEHLIWEILEGDIITRLQKIFATNIPHTYIADGHHRSSCTALLYQRHAGRMQQDKYSRLLCAFLPASELDVHDYNRVIEGLEDISLTRFMAKLSAVFEIEPLDGPDKPSQKHELTMLLNKEWFRLNWKKKVLQANRDVVTLDANLLNQHVLQGILGIRDVRNDARIKYVEGPLGTEEVKLRTNRNEDRVGFCLHPIELEALMKVADAGLIMPPKSTWFEPRMKNGLIAFEIE